MALVQTRRSISVNRSMYERAKIHAASLGKSLSQFCCEVMEQAMQPPEPVAEPEPPHPDQLVMFREAEPQSSTMWPTTVVAVQRAPRLSGIRIQRTGGYDPALGKNHPNNQDSTLQPKGKAKP